MAICMAMRQSKQPPHNSWTKLASYRVHGRFTSVLTIMSVPSADDDDSQGSSNARPVTPALWCTTTAEPSRMRRSCASTRPSPAPVNSMREFCVPSTPQMVPSWSAWKRRRTCGGDAGVIVCRHVTHAYDATIRVHGYPCVFMGHPYVS